MSISREQQHPPGNDTEDLKNKVLREIDRLHKELVEEGVPATATILKRFSRGVSLHDDTEKYFLKVEVDRGDGKPYIVKKYRPWLPDRCQVDEYHSRERKPYYWCIPSCFYEEFKEGATLPIRVHPTIADLIEFDVNIDEDKLYVDPYQANHPIAFDKWQKGEPDTSALDIRPDEDEPEAGLFLEVMMIIVNYVLYIFGKRDLNHIALIKQLQSELKTEGIPVTARVVNFKQPRNGSSPRDNYHPNLVFLDLEIQQPGREAYRVTKYRPWQGYYMDWWYFSKAEMDLIEPDVLLPVVVHPRIPLLIDFKSNLERTKDPFDCSIDRGYDKKLFEKWQAEAEQEGMLNGTSS